MWILEYLHKKLSQIEWKPSKLQSDMVKMSDLIEMVLVLRECVQICSQSYNRGPSMLSVY